MNSKPSKSARKREQHALQALGEALIGLDPEQLLAIGLDERLRDAVIAARSIRSHGALRRQKQLIGKLMRQADPEPIRAALERAARSDRFDKKAFRTAESWRDRIAGDDPGALEAYFACVGRQSEAVAEAAAALGSARDDRSLKTAKRRLFREIHREILQRMQNEGDSI